ncbi:S8 family serine peptidase [Ruegeria marina]|uniref:Subtilase family protein n=1 Tax=Ruegeria marina TaxID=639004 RepID=A0A1G7FM02_9RHOB|nr:S8 family serine peptidase [Ruegeria marina]SDE76932.1 Subtilase family protein [Ruegeria marina]
MAIKMFLFDRNRDTLKSNLSKVGYDLVDLVNTYGLPGFILPPGQTNNPWVPVDRDGNVSHGLSGSDIGFGIPLLLPDADKARNLLKDFRDKAIAAGEPEAARVLGVELEPSTMDLAPNGQHWCAGHGMGVAFGSRKAARGLIRADVLKARGLTGEGTKVFVVDRGFSKNYVQSLGGTYGGGLGILQGGNVTVPGIGTEAYVPLQMRHGSMLLRSLVDLAPDAEFFDLPLLPARITDVEYFALRALFAFFAMDWFFLSSDENWVILNAWGIVDRFAERVRGEYTNNPDHWLNVMIAGLGRRHDIVFAAGNNGQFCADPRASGYDRGPGQSIFGANGLKDVTSVAAVRCDGAWIGASSQGPGPANFDPDGGLVEKPDLSAPSWFVENRNAGLRSSGTSGASAIVAGAIAALRSGWGNTVVSPVQMRSALRAGTRRISGSGWDNRTGAGLLNLDAAISELPS